MCVSRQNHANIEATGNLVLVAIVRINIYSTRHCKRLPHFTSRLSDRFQILHTPYGGTEFSPTMVRGGQCTCDSCRSSRAAVCVCGTGDGKSLMLGGLHAKCDKRPSTGANAINTGVKANGSSVRQRTGQVCVCVCELGVKWQTAPNRDNRGRRETDYIVLYGWSGFVSKCCSDSPAFWLWNAS